MNSLQTLNELREAKKKKQHEQEQREKIKEQFSKIMQLQEKKNVLTSELDVLIDGGDPLSEEDAELQSLRGTLRELKEMLAVHRLLGPCGLTVLEMNSSYLVVSFTALWRNLLTQSFVLKIVDVDGNLKVEKTTIPHFMNVQTLLDSSQTPDWPRFMDKIAQMLNAYTHRKGMMEYVKKQNSEIKSCSANDAITVVEMKLEIEETESSPSLKTMNLYLSFVGLEDILPSQVEIKTDGTAMPEKELRQLKQIVKETPLSEAMTSVVEALRNVRSPDSGRGSEGDDTSGE